MWPPSSVCRSGFAQSWGVLPARVLGTERRGGAPGYQCKAVPGRGGKAVPCFSRDFPGGTLILKRVVAIFGATQKVRKSPLPHTCRHSTGLAFRRSGQG